MQNHTAMMVTKISTKTNNHSSEFFFAVKYLKYWHNYKSKSEYKRLNNYNY